MRFIDISLSLIGLLVLLPTFMIVIPILRLTGEKEVFYRQERVGKDHKYFEVLKFATMLKQSPFIGAGTITEKNDPRVLPVGRVLRKTKINELPQLFNILGGSMSIVGPRPHAPNDLAGVPADMLRRTLHVKPGLTGIGSIVFRNEEAILHDKKDARDFYDTVIAPYKASLEIWYIERSSVGLNIILMVLTALVVLGWKPQGVFTCFKSLPPLPAELEPYF